jgi:hypothetical protein
LFFSKNIKIKKRYTINYLLVFDVNIVILYCFFSESSLIEIKTKKDKKYNLIMSKKNPHKLLLLLFLPQFFVKIVFFFFRFLQSLDQFFVKKAFSFSQGNFMTPKPIRLAVNPKTCFVRNAEILENDFFPN